MNHPSDYMFQYRQSSSEDESNHNISLQMRYSHTEITKTKIMSTSLYQHPGKNMQKRKKQDKNKREKGGRGGGKAGKGKARKNKGSDFIVFGDNYYPCDNLEQISHRLMNHPSSRIMQDQRVKKKQKNCVKKIEKYLQTFALQLYISRKRTIRIEQKIEMYRILREEEQREKKESHIEQLLIHLVSNIQKQTEEMIVKDPVNSGKYLHWKNIKMHQLMAAQSILSNQAIQSIQIFDLSKQLNLIKEERFFPEMRLEALNLQQQISRHMSYHDRERAGEKQDEGVRWVLDKLFSFITDDMENWQRVGYILQLYSQGNTNEPLLSDILFIQFQKRQIGSSQTEKEEVDKKYMHIFNKSIFDLINQTIIKMEHIEPTEECLKNIFVAADGSIFSEEMDEWREDLIMWVGCLVEDVLFDECLQELIDFI